MEGIIQRHGRIFRGRPVSFNPNPRWPKGYFEVLEEAGIPEREHSFFARTTKIRLATQTASKKSCNQYHPSLSSKRSLS